MLSVPHQLHSEGNVMLQHPLSSPLFGWNCVLAMLPILVSTRVWSVPPESVLTRDITAQFTSIPVATISPTAGSLTQTQLSAAAVPVGTGADLCEGATVTSVAVGPPGSPTTVTITGDNSAALTDSCVFSFLTWWEAFEFDKCAKVTIDFCGTIPTHSPSLNVFVRKCPCDGTDEILPNDIVSSSSFDRATCGDGNLTMTFDSVPSGINYLPILSDPLFTPNLGPYTIKVTAEECSGACTECRGSCCVTTAETCADSVLETDCIAADQVWNRTTACCETECRDPAGGEFDASGINLLSRVTIADFATFTGIPGTPHEANEMWGYTSPLGRKYAIIGFTTGTGFVDITHPRSPTIVGYIDGGVDDIWRDMDVYREHAYIVNDSQIAGNGPGIQIVDLSQIDSGVVALVAESDLGIAMTTAHNISINPDTGFLYLSLPYDLNGELGFTVAHISDPTNPQFVGFWTDTDPDVRCHDMQVISYDSGPFAEVAFCFAEDDGLRIVDVSNKAAMTRLGKLLYPGVSYCHQGWVGDDRKYLYFGDELDEYFDVVTNTRSYIVDIQDLTNPTLASTFDHDGCWIDHNLMVRGSRVYQAHYTAGLRVLDVSNPLIPSEIAHFDTRPEDDLKDFFGMWGVFTDYPSRIVTCSDRQRGLFVVCDEPATPIPSFVVDQNPIIRGESVQFDAISSTTCDPSRTLATYEWDYRHNGVSFNVQATGINSIHSYQTLGSFTVALRVTDDLGAQSISTFEVSVQPTVPATSTWGIVLLGLLVLITSTIAIRRACIFSMREH